MHVQALLKRYVRSQYSGGVKPVKVEALEYFEGLEEVLSTLRSSGEVKSGDVIILTYGLKDEPVHLVKIVQIQ